MSKGGDISRVSQCNTNYRYPKYHKISNRSICTDMLEMSGFIIVKISARSCRAAAFQDWV